MLWFRPERYAASSVVLVVDAIFERHADFLYCCNISSPLVQYEFDGVNIMPQFFACLFCDALPFNVKCVLADQMILLDLMLHICDFSV